MEAFYQAMYTFLNELTVNSGQGIAIIVIGIIAFLIFRLGVRRTLFYYQKKGSFEEVETRKLISIAGWCLFLIFVVSALTILRFDEIIYRNEYFSVTIPALFKGVLIFQIARLINYFLNRTINRYYKTKLAEKSDHPRLEQITKRDSNKIASSSITFAIAVLGIYLLFQNFGFDPEIFRFNADSENPSILKLSKVLIAVLVLLLGQVFIWALTQLILLRYYNQNKINVGAQFAINQLISYFIYMIAIVSALNFLGIQMTVVWGGLAALLVGLGLGLQQTFNDLFSGILLLFERGIEIGEVVEINGVVGYVKKIGLRTSIIESRDNITMIVPNSKLVTDNVINWSHYDNKVRFRIGVGVAYGSDTALVKKILLETAKENSFILKFPSPNVRFMEFGSSSLDFELLFYSKNFIVIEDIKSDIRFEIDRKFREANISIPFPQRDVWMR